MNDVGPSKKGPGDQKSEGSPVAVPTLGAWAFRESALGGGSLLGIGRSVKFSTAWWVGVWVRQCNRSVDENGAEYAANQLLEYATGLVAHCCESAIVDPATIRRMIQSSMSLSVAVFISSSSGY